MDMKCPFFDNVRIIDSLVNFYGYFIQYETGPVPNSKGVFPNKDKYCLATNMKTAQGSRYLACSEGWSNPQISLSSTVGA